MYRVLIVDDEPEIRTGLRLKVDWDALHLKVEGEASNGREALEWIASGMVDIVITDMNMPIMNGVSFLELCYEQYPDIKLIVITGYEDFQYTRAAIRNHARDYLLKPVSKDELMAALGKVTEELDKARIEHNQQMAMNWRLSEYYKEMKEHFIVHMVKVGFDNETMIRERAKLFQLECWESTPVHFITSGLRERLMIDGHDERTPQKLRIPFEMICREFASAHVQQTLVFRDGNYPGLMNFVVQGDERSVSIFASELQECVKGNLAFEPTVGIGEDAIGFREWKEAYSTSLLAWSLSDSIKIGYTRKAQFEDKELMTEEWAKATQRCLVRGELEVYEQMLNKELTRAFFENQAHFVKLIFKIYLVLDTSARSSDIMLASREQLWIRPDQVLGLDTVEKAETFLMSLAHTIYLKLNDVSEDPNHSGIEAARQFIQNNYMYELNLTMLAERFNYNPSYFSELFKAKIGKTFIQYLTDVRMAEAVRLLENSNLGLWDISELIGLGSASYFSSKFKRMYGMNPSDYRNKYHSPEKINNQSPKK